MKKKVSSNGKKILTILWHPDEENITAGGFLRTLEILRRYKGQFGKITVLDSMRSFLPKSINSNLIIHEYRIPIFIKVLEKINYSLERVLEWLWSMCAILIFAIRHRQEYNILYVPYSENIVLSVPGLIIKSVLKKKVVFCNLNVVPGIYTIINNFTHRHIDKVYTISHSLVKDLRDSGMNIEMDINYTGIDVESIDQVKQQSKRHKYDAVFIGRHVFTKGIYDYIDLLERMVKLKTDFRFITAGSCSPKVKQDIKRKLHVKGLTNNWIYLGVVSEAKKYELLKNSKMLWFLSTVEGWGIVPQEALASRILAVCYNLPVYKESISDCPAVFLAETGNVQSAYEMVCKIQSLNKAEYDNLTVAGHDFVKRFDWNVVAEREYKLITE